MRFTASEIVKLGQLMTAIRDLEKGTGICVEACRIGIVDELFPVSPRFYIDVDEGVPSLLVNEPEGTDQCHDS